MSRPFSRLLRIRIPILLVWGALTLAGGGLLAGRFDIDNSVGVWFPADDPALETYEKYLEEFGHWEWTVLLLETESVTDPRFAADLRRLTARLGSLEHVNRVVSLPRETPRGAGSEPLTRLLHPDPEGRRTVVLLETANFIHRGDTYRVRLLEGIEKAVGAAPTIRGHAIGGTSSVNVALNETARRDMVVFSSLVGLLVSGISLFLFRSWRDTTVLLLTSLSTASVTLGLITACGYSLNMITIMLPTVLIALSVADVVHLIHAFHQKRGELGSEGSLDHAVRELWLPCLGTSLTTMAGFLSLTATSMLPVLHLAAFAAFGILLAWVLTLSVSPLLLFHLWRDVPSHPGSMLGSQMRSLRSLAGWLPRRRLAVGLLFLVACTALGGLGKLTADTNYLEFFRSGSRLPEAYARLKEAGVPQSQLSVVLDGIDGSEGADQLEALDALARRIEGLPTVRQVIDPALMTGPPDARGATPTQLSVLTEFISSREIRDLVGAIEAIGTETFPAGVELIVTGSPVLWTRMDADLLRTQRRSLVLVTVLALLILTGVFRSFPMALLGMLVSFFPVAIVLGIMGHLGVPIDFATVLIAGITLGLAVDDTIHFVFAFRKRVRAGVSAPQAAAQTLVNVGSRLIITSIILAGSFACMAVSDFKPSANFGMFTALTILVALILDLTALPLVLGAVQRQPQQFWQPFRWFIRKLSVRHPF